MIKPSLVKNIQSNFDGTVDVTDSNNVTFKKCYPMSSNTEFVNNKDNIVIECNIEIDEKNKKRLKEWQKVLNRKDVK